MTYDFDKIVDRRNTNSIKHDFAVEFGKPADILPLWVADMDFAVAFGIQERLRQAVEHGIFGYSDAKQGYFQAVAAWYQKHFNWKVEEEWLIRTPGVVFALATAVRAFTEEGDGVMVQQPVYYPFGNVIRENGRCIVNNPLQLTDGRYRMDFVDMEQKIEEHKVKLFLLCSPHNPVGRVWEEQELRRLGDICRKHGVVIVSDEIHSDFTFPGKVHHMLASLAEEYRDITVTCTAPSKTFNLAGLQVSNIFISNKELRERFKKAVARTGYNGVNLMGLLACQAAYEEGEEWLVQLKSYLTENLAYLRTYLADKLPEIKLVEPEGTYLIWLDCRELKLSAEELERFLVEEAGLWLDVGDMFGAEGEGFARINIACPRKLLTDALERLGKAAAQLRVEVANGNG